MANKANEKKIPNYEESHRCGRSRRSRRHRLPGGRRDSQREYHHVLSALHSAGWYSNENGDASLVNNGRLVCEMLDNGNTQWAVTNAVYQHTDSNVDWADAQEFVRVAEIHLCW